MKTTLCAFSVLSLAFFFSCNEPQREQNVSSAETNEPHKHSEVLPNLRLNKGARWKVGDATNKSIMQLQSIVELYEIEKNKTLAGYLEAGKKLEAGINVLIENCKLSGAEHDALHEWLQPFMEDAEALSKVKNQEEGELYFEKVDAMLHKYYEYFE